MADQHQDLHVFAVEILAQELLSKAQLELLISHRLTPELLLKLPLDQYAAKVGLEDPELIGSLRELATELLEQAGRTAPRPLPRLSWMQRIFKSRPNSQPKSRPSISSSSALLFEGGEADYLVMEPLQSPNHKKKAKFKYPKVMEEDLSAQALAQSLLGLELIQLSEVGMVEESGLTLQLAMGQLNACPRLPGLSPESAMGLVDYVRVALNRVSPRLLARLLMRNQVNLTAHEAKCLVRFQIKYSALKYYSVEGLEDIGLTSALTQARLANWIAETETTNAVVETKLRDMSALQLANVLVQREVIAEHEAETLVRANARFDSLAQIANKFTNNVTQNKLALYHGTQSAQLVAAFQEAVSLVAVELLLQSPHLSLAKCSSTKVTAYSLLHLAAKVHNVSPQFVSVLLAGGCVVDARDVLGNTPLMLACRCGNEDTVRQLVQHGASVTLENQFGFTALDVAVQYSAPSTVIACLISAGADVNHCSKLFQGHTLLWLAVERNHVGNVAALLAAGADWRRAAPGNNGGLVCFAVQRNGDAAITQLLIQHVGKPIAQAPNLLGFSPMRLLAQQGHRANADIARVLVRSGAKVIEENGKVNLVLVSRRHHAPGAPVASPALVVLQRGLMIQALVMLLAGKTCATSALCRLPVELVRVLGSFVA
ncbi:hypothetical protein BASA81_003785 [Batrachochytrium salamandrivorans]|nr:hypothetical protein BASA81_003785 [Batrachochytrium salamandrivorans]